MKAVASMTRAAVAGLLGLTAAAVVTPSGALADPAGGSAATAAAIKRVLASAPSDPALAAATDGQLVDLAVRCAAIESQTYCLHWGWDPAGTASQALRIQATASAAELGKAASTGDAPLALGLRRWAALPKAERDAAEQAELAEAQAVVGKVIWFDALGSGKALPADFAKAHPQFAAWGDPSTVAKTGLVSTEQTFTLWRAEKQTTGSYCGPASLQALVWNDPKAPVYRAQNWYAGTPLHTNANGSTWIYDLKDAINTYTHWDDSDYASTYIVTSITNWNNDNWSSLLRSHIVNLRAPVQLHPKLSPSVSSYYPGTTGGHFDVGEGWYDDGTVSLYEPAGGTPQGNIYTNLWARETINNIRLANLNNTNQRNIAY